MSDKEQAALRSRLEALLRRPENQTCADCRARMPRWASTNLGIFLCTSCSGIHRGLGVHISKVRSCALDKWTADQVAGMEAIGNARANTYWEANPPGAYDRPAEGDMGRLNQFIRDKYERGVYSAKGHPAPRCSSSVHAGSAGGYHDKAYVLPQHPGSSSNLTGVAPTFGTTGHNQPQPPLLRKPLPPTPAAGAGGSSGTTYQSQSLLTETVPAPSMHASASAPAMRQRDWFADLGGAEYHGGYQSGYMQSHATAAGQGPLGFQTAAPGQRQAGAFSDLLAPPPPPSRPVMRPGPMGGSGTTL